MKEYIAFGVGMMLALACIMLLENIEAERNEERMKKSSLLSVMIEGMKLVVSMYEICRTEKKRRK